MTPMVISEIYRLDILEIIRSSIYWKKAMKDVIYTNCIWTPSAINDLNFAITQKYAFSQSFTGYFLLCL